MRHREEFPIDGVPFQRIEAESLQDSYGVFLPLSE